MSFWICCELVDFALDFVMLFVASCDMYNACDVCYDIYVMSVIYV